jgi:signal transduction histidine kinase
VTTRHDEVCTLLQEIGLPVVRVKLVSGEIVGFNELFASLVDPPAPLDDRESFAKVVLHRLAAPDRTSWEAAFANQTPAQVPVAFKSADGRALDFEMRSFVYTSSKRPAQSIVCVFIPLDSRHLDRLCETRFSEGQAVERRRIRSELHKGVSQQLLGAAFGCKILAGRVAILSEDLGKEASDLANLVNEAVMELQNLVQSDENHQ